MELVFRKLKADEIDVRVGRVIDTQKWQGVSLLLYKDARCDMDLLDETVGAMNWQREHSRDNANCRVGIWDADKGQWVWKEDTGTESNTEAAKGLASDSFKRACTNWGIGRELYTAKNILVPCQLVNGKAPSRAKWYVSEIGYDENGNINNLIIVDQNGETAYALKNGATTRENAKHDKQVKEIKETQHSANSSDLDELQRAENECYIDKTGAKKRIGDLNEKWLQVLAQRQDQSDNVIAAARTILRLKYNAED